MVMLNKLRKEYFLPLELYSRLKKSVTKSVNQDTEEMNQFLDALPNNLRIEVSLYLHEETYKHLNFLHDKSMSLVAWICPLLKTYLIAEDEYVYFEGDEVLNIHFVKDGSCGYVLPKYENSKFIDIPSGLDFGIEDIMGSILKDEFVKEEDWISQKERLIRQFTVMASRNTELLTLSIVDLHRMQLEFIEAYAKFIDTGYMRLEYALLVKLECISHCQEKYNKL